MSDEILATARARLCRLLDKIPDDGTASQLEMACRLADAVCAVTREMRIQHTFERQEEPVH